MTRGAERRKRKRMGLRQREKGRGKGKKKRAVELKREREGEPVPAEMGAGGSLFRKLDGETKSGCAFLNLIISCLPVPQQIKELGYLCWEFQLPK